MPSVLKIKYPEACTCDCAAKEELCLCRTCNNTKCAPCHQKKWKHKEELGCEIVQCSNYTLKAFFKKFEKHFDSNVEYHGKRYNN